MKIARIIATSTVAACLIATSVFAVNTTSTSTPTKAPKATVTPSKNKGKLAAGRDMDRKGHRGFDGFDKMKGNLFTSLVTAGTITAEQKTAIENAIKEAREAKKDVKEALDALVKAGTITQAQEDAVIKAMPMGRGGHNGFHGNKLDELVTAKTITAEQKTAVENAVKTACEAKKDVKEALDALVKAGTITQAQEDAVIKAMPMGRGGHNGFHGNKLNELVTAKTITAEQKTAVENAIKGAREAKKDVKEALDALVKAGTITQAQEDAVIKAMPTGKGKHMRMHKDQTTAKPSATPTPKAQ
jgi:competence protein ComGC